MQTKFTTSALLAPFKHGFFTRRGGKSSGIYASLNCGARNSDDPVCVSENRRIVAQSVSAALTDLITCRQIHSANAEVIRERPKGTLEADALATSNPDLAVSVLSADCMPVLFADSRKRVVAAAHAGWKGSLAGILGATIAKMEQLGCRRGSISAVIGPSISRKNYEVGEEFRELFLQTDSRSARFFHHDDSNRLVFDLPGYGLMLLNSENIGRAEWIGHCTYSNPSDYFSYRRSCHNKEGGTGLLISAISPQTVS